MRGYRYKTRYRIHKTSSYRYKTRYRIHKTSSYRYKTRYRIQKNSRYQYRNEVTDTVPHKEKCGTYKSQNSRDEADIRIKNSECRFHEEYYQFTVTTSRYLSPMKRGEVPRGRTLWIQKILPPRGEIGPEPGRRIRNGYRILWRPVRPHRPSPQASHQPRQAR
jgi:hypothetical protein